MAQPYNTITVLLIKNPKHQHIVSVGISSIQALTITFCQQMVKHGTTCPTFNHKQLSEQALKTITHTVKQLEFQLKD